MTTMNETTKAPWPSDKGKKLVKGYITEQGWRECRHDLEYIEQCARHIALFEDGTIKITKDHIKLACTDFNRKFEWEVIQKMPSDVEFVGNYPADM
ncbi:hypothetical protein RAD16_32735 [Bradyrhizobium sp. 18BD]